MSKMPVQDFWNQAVRLGQGWRILVHITGAFKCFSRALRRLRGDWLEGLPEKHWNLFPEIELEADDDEPSVNYADGGILSEPPPHELKAGEEEDVLRSGSQQSAIASTGQKRGYRGIRDRQVKSTLSWVTEIRPTCEAQTIWLGSYATPEEAARAYDVGTYYCNKKRKHNYNFPDSIHNLPACDEILKLPANQRKKKIQNLAKEVALMGSHDKVTPTVKSQNHYCGPLDN